jgi:hypothetical protein
MQTNRKMTLSTTYKSILNPASQVADVSIHHVSYSSVVVMSPSEQQVDSHKPFLKRHERAVGIDNWQAKTLKLYEQT